MYKVNSQLIFYVSAKMRESAGPVRQYSGSPGRACFPKGRRPYGAGTKHRWPRGLVAVRSAG